MMDHRETALNHLYLASETGDRIKGTDLNHAHILTLEVAFRVAGAITHAILDVATAIRSSDPYQR